MDDHVIRGMDPNKVGNSTRHDCATLVVQRSFDRNGVMLNVGDRFTTRDKAEFIRLINSGQATLIETTAMIGTR